MEVLHICSDYPGSSVHRNLYEKLDERGIKQYIYCYFGEKKYEGRNYFEGKAAKIYYACILKKYDRYFYHYKGYKVARDLKRRIDVGKIDVIHATTLFSDGGIAYRLHKEYHIPYIVTVRNSDINIHLKKAYHEWPYVKKILKNAERVIFISEALKNAFYNHSYIKNILLDIENKIIVQPNGIDDFWFDHCAKDRQIPPENHKLIYVGVFDSNKNIFRMIDAVLHLRAKYHDIHLTLVGGRGELKLKVKLLADAHSDVIDYIGLVNDKEKLRDIYREHSVFVMPSIYETFGLVYIEALSQGLACVFTKGQGIDGMFTKDVGEAVNPMSVEDIARGIDRILQNRKIYNNINLNLELFRWEKIAGKYEDLYNLIVK